MDNPMAYELRGGGALREVSLSSRFAAYLNVA